MDDQIFCGSCLCGAIAYEIRPPFLFFHHCHCSRCRKSSGTAHSSNILLKKAQLAFQRGADSLCRFELPSAEHFCTTWCGRCGSQMPWLTRNGKYYIVPAGTLDDDPHARPDKNIHWQSRADWYVDVRKLPIHDEE